MVEIRAVDTENKKQVKEFVQFHYDLYKTCPQWVPPFRNDIEIMLNKKSTPFMNIRTPPSSQPGKTEKWSDAPRS